jgi:hypothetical protein
MITRDLYNTLSKMYEKGSQANGDRFSIMTDVRRMIARNLELQQIADEVSKARRESRNGAPSMVPYHLIHELGYLLNAMKEKYSF